MAVINGDTGIDKVVDGSIGTNDLAAGAVTQAKLGADAYTTGTWTPNQGGGLTLVGSFSSSGEYVKIGKQVTVHGKFIGSTTVAAASAGVMCTNLPFTAGGESGVGVATNSALSGVTGLKVQTATTTMYASGAIAATNVIPFTATYFTA